jgi:hypothetical protein
MNTLHKILAFISIVSMIGCSATDPLSILTQKAVVEGYLAANQPIDIKITKEIPFSDSTMTLQTLDNLSIKVEGDGKSFILKPDTAGHYKSDVLIQEGKTYTMSFDYNGKTISASTTIPTKPKSLQSSAATLVIPVSGFGGQFPNPISISWDNATGDYFLIVVKNTELYPELINPSRPGGNRFFRQQPTQANIQQINARQFSFLGNHDVILYHVNSEYASLYNDSGNNSLNLQAPYSNVDNGLGIFTGISADTVRILISR